MRLQRQKKEREKNSSLGPEVVSQEREKWGEPLPLPSTFQESVSRPWNRWGYAAGDERRPRITRKQSRGDCRRPSLYPAKACVETKVPRPPLGPVAAKRRRKANFFSSGLQNTGAKGRQRISAKGCEIQRKVPTHIGERARIEWGHGEREGISKGRR